MSLVEPRPNPKLPVLAAGGALLVLAAIVGVLVWTFPQQPADWYWFTGRVLVAIPLAILAVHAGAQGVALGRSPSAPTKPESPGSSPI